MAARQITLFGSDTKQAFEEYHAAHPELLRILRRACREVLEAGHDKYSIAGIFERVRWRMQIARTDEDYMLNNNFKPHYARLLMRTYPELDGFFDLRETAQ